MSADLGFYLIGPGSYAHVPWEDGIAAVAEAGFRGVDVSASKGVRTATSSRDFSAAERRRLRSLVEAAALRVDAIVTHAGLVQTIAAGDPLDLIGAVDVGADLGSPLLLLHIGTATDADRAELWPAAVAQVRAAADHAATVGLAVCLDSVAPDFLTSTPAEVERFLNEVDRPNIGWNFDPGYVAACGYDMADVERRLGRWIRHGHLKDYRGSYPTQEWLIPGEGDLDDAWTGVLDRIGFDGAVSAEIIAMPRNAPQEKWPVAEAARRSYEGMRAALSRA